MGFLFFCANFGLRFIMRELIFCIRRTTMLIVLVAAAGATTKAQERPLQDTLPRTDSFHLPIDSIEAPLRIKNLNPYFTLHVDSTLNYNLEINKDEANYYWFLRNSPVGLRINKDNGQLSFKADKTLFLSGKLKYDNEYRVNIGVQNLNDPSMRVDTSFSILFYNTDIIHSRLKPTVSSTLTVDEGDTVSFKVQCENGNFSIDNITFFANMPLKNFTLVKKCDDDFIWSPPFDFVKETDSGRVRILLLSFVGANKFNVRDTAIVRVVIRDALNYPLAKQEYDLQVSIINTYLLQLKYTFVQLDKRVKKVKNTRTTFDITGSTTALTGSIMSTSTSESTKKTGQIMPSLGVSLVPIKEAVAPQKVFDQNQASTVRAAVKRLTYMIQDNSLVGERDPDITKKMNKLKEELKQIQIQLIDVPIEMTAEMTEEELNRYINSPRVNKKYRLKKK
jgi:hypothetical protein